MKECFKCKKHKVLSEFYKHSQMKDGHVNKCKECNKKDVNENYKKNIDHYKAYEKTEKRKKSHNERSKKFCKKYRKLNPKKYKAHQIVNNSIRSGILIKSKTCSECNSNYHINAHHDDYNKPLEVRWLCSSCHNYWHKHNQALNQY